MNKATDHGLNDRQLTVIKTIIASTTDAVEKVALFGSRANGNYKPYSDIDIVLYGDIPKATRNRLWTRFVESTLPQKVDINAYQHINYPPLKNHIDENAKLLFSKRELYSGGGGDGRRY